MPRDPHGREVVFPYANAWSLKVARDYQQGEYDIAGYKPVKFESVPDWSANPYNNTDWQFNFYSLRSLKDLLNASQDTHDDAYAKQAVLIINSFLSDGTKQPQAWSDGRTVAWRAMMLTSAWYKLRSQNQLPISTSTAILKSLQQHANYLLAGGHYNPGSGQGISESAALFQVGLAFPTLPGASNWLHTGRSRLSVGFNDTFGNDGSIKSRSASDAVSFLAQYWDIYDYADKQHDQLGTTLGKRINAMIDYAAYLLQPDLRAPLTGSSVNKKINSNIEYSQMTAHNSHLEYVLHQGNAGKAPALTNVQYKDAGQTIFRSSWSKKAYTDQTQVIFNYGSYASSHSQLDSLGLNLYGDGTALLPGPGAYTYQPGRLYDYFHGTSSHNLVLVDSKDQQAGSGVAGTFTSTSGYASQAASSQLIDGVTQERQILTLGSNLVLVIDKEASAQQHTYDQRFHVFPGASLTSHGLDVTATGAGAKQLKITQLQTSGIRKNTVLNSRPPATVGGVCSQQYGVLLACPQIDYQQTGMNARYVTLLQVGHQPKDLSYMIQGDVVTVRAAGVTYKVSIAQTTERSASIKASNTTAATPKTAIINRMSNPGDWQLNGGTLSQSGGSGDDPNANSLTITTVAGAVNISRQIQLDLSDKNLVFDMNLKSSTAVNDLNLVLYSGDVRATQKLRSVYANVTDNDPGQTIPIDQSVSGWSRISLARGSERTSEGQWIIEGGKFDWSKITKIAFQMEPTPGMTAEASFQDLAAYPSQPVGKVAIVFDDGSSSIQPAVDVMNAYGMKGSIAVIGKYPGTGLSGYLSINDLKVLKQQGWSLINHSYYHQDAITAYYDQNRLGDFQADLLKGAEFLEQNGLDTDPNWYIYPHGTTNGAIQKIVGKYYKYARTELTAPEAYPFGNSLAVKDFVVQNTTTVANIKAAIADANRYHQTLLITFHRIHAEASDQAGYDMASFRQIIQYLSTTKSHVMSLNQLDASNGVSTNRFDYTPARPELLDASVRTARPSLLKRLTHMF